MDLAWSSVKCDLEEEWSGGALFTFKWVGETIFAHELETGEENPMAV